MPNETRIVSPHYKPRTVKLDDGSTLVAPADWSLLPPGDAGLTRRVTAAGPSWTVKQAKGRKVFSYGVWAPTETIEREKQKLEEERETPEYQRRREADAARRDRAQTAYVEEFRQSVVAFLQFHEDFKEFEQKLADAVTEHATPVGSGTVARTKMIDVEDRAEAAVIAWMRHQTTAYDHMKIERVKGKRREVRRELAQISRNVLQAYRKGTNINTESCPLAKALARIG